MRGQDLIPCFRKTRVAASGAALLSLKGARRERRQERVVKFLQWFQTTWGRHGERGCWRISQKGENGIKVVYDTFPNPPPMRRWRRRLLAGKKSAVTIVVVSPPPVFSEAQVQGCFGHYSSRRKKTRTSRESCKLSPPMRGPEVKSKRNGLAVFYGAGNKRFFWRPILHVGQHHRHGYICLKKSAESARGPMPRIDAGPSVFKPEGAARFSRELRGINLLDSATDILPAALDYLRLDFSQFRPKTGRASNKAAGSRLSQKSGAVFLFRAKFHFRSAYFLGRAATVRKTICFVGRFGPACTFMAGAKKSPAGGKGEGEKKKTIFFFIDWIGLPPTRSEGRARRMFSSTILHSADAAKNKNVKESLTS